MGVVAVELGLVLKLSLIVENNTLLLVDASIDYICESKLITFGKIPKDVYLYAC